MCKWYDEEWLPSWGSLKFVRYKLACQKLQSKKWFPLYLVSFLSLKTSCVSVNASYCRALCAEHHARLPTISDFNATDHVIKNFAFPGGSVQKLSLNKQYLPVRKGLSLKTSYRAAFSFKECFSLEIVVIP